MTTLSEQSLRCPLCATVFATEVLQTWDQVGPRTADLRRLSPELDPLPHLVHACPDCGFCGLDGEYQPGHLDPATLVAGGTLATVVRERFGTSETAGEEGAGPVLATPDPAIAYERCAQIAELRGAPPLTVGDRYLRAAWLHDDARRTDDERRCRSEALRWYREALSSPGGFRRREDMVVVAYLAGEQERRVGDTGRANELYRRAAEMAAPHPAMHELAALARQQATDPQEYIEQ